MVSGLRITAVCRLLAAAMLRWGQQCWSTSGGDGDGDGAVKLTGQLVRRRDAGRIFLAGRDHEKTPASCKRSH